MGPGEPSSGATWAASQTATHHIGPSSRAEQQVTFPGPWGFYEGHTPPSQVSREPALSPVQYLASDHYNVPGAVARVPKLSEWPSHFLLLREVLTHTGRGFEVS